MTKVGRDTFIYVLLDPRFKGVKAVRYVGKANDVDARRRSHILSARAALAASTGKNKWILELLSLGLEPKSEIVETVYGKKGWQEREAFWVAWYDSKGAVLLNIAPPGMGGPLDGRHHTWLARKRMSLSHKGKQKTEAHMKSLRKTMHSESYREHQRISSTGRRHSERAKQKIAESHIGVAAKIRDVKTWKKHIAAGIHKFYLAHPENASERAKRAWATRRKHKEKQND